MRKLFLEIAGLNYEFCFHIPEWQKVVEIFVDELKKFYGGFMLDKPPKKIDYSIHFVPEYKSEILTNNKTQKTYINFFEIINENKIKTSYQISIFHVQLILGYFLKKGLTEHNGVFIHASAAIINNKAFLFCGPPGAGKSTTIKLLRGKYPIIADDSVILMRTGAKYTIYQTPFYEKEWWVEKKRFPYELGGVIFVIKANEFSIKLLNKKEAVLRKALKQVWRKKGTFRQEKLMLEFVNNFDYFYTLKFEKDKKKLIELLEKTF